MKIRILVYENISYKDKVLDICKQNRFLKSNTKNIIYFNDNNWEEVFKNVVVEFKIAKKFDKLCIFTNEGYWPFFYFSKEIGFVAACPFDVATANLCRAHNNANTLVITKFIKKEQVNNVINAFFVSDFDGGRHATRYKLMQEPYVKTSKTFKFDDNKQKTIVLASDHAGYAFKSAIKKYLVKKGYKIIDVGCSSLDSTHYPLYAIALVKNAHKASAGIAFCSTGVGMANTINNFRGMNCFICHNPEQAKAAREHCNANVMAVASRFINFEDCVKAVDTFLNTKKGSYNQNILNMDNYGFDLDMNKFKEIELEKNIEIPKELK